MQNTMHAVHNSKSCFMQELANSATLYQF